MRAKSYHWLIKNYQLERYELMYELEEKMKKYLVLLTVTFTFMITSYSQLLDNYDGTGDLTYITEGVWVISGGQLEAQTGGVSIPEHSYASYDLSLSNSSWSLSKDKQNEWIGWMDLNRTSVSGWSTSYYSCGMVLAAVNSDFNDPTTTGYAIGFQGDGDSLVVFKFSSGITNASGSSNLPAGSTLIVKSGYIYSNSDNGVNFYVKLESDGKWTVKYKAGIKLSDEAATNPSNYSDGSVTSSTSDETYNGTSYKWSGWIYAHETGVSEKAYFDNFGIGTVDQSLPVSLQDFNAVPGSGKVTLCWITESETENLGFNLYRSTALNGQFTIINNQLIPGHGSTSERHEYLFNDRDVINGVTYYYKLEDVDYAGKAKLHDKVVSATPTSIESDANINQFRLYPCYPNPFNPSTNIRISLPETAPVKLQVYNLNGELISTLVNTSLSAGEHSFTWSGRDHQNRLVGTGIYFLQISGDRGFSRTQKVIFLR